MSDTVEIPMTEEEEKMRKLAAYSRALRDCEREGWALGRKGKKKLIPHEWAQDEERLAAFNKGYEEGIRTGIQD